MNWTDIKPHVQKVSKLTSNKIIGWNATCVKDEYITLIGEGAIKIRRTVSHDNTSNYCLSFLNLLGDTLYEETSELPETEKTEILKNLYELSETSYLRRDEIIDGIKNTIDKLIGSHQECNVSPAERPVPGNDN